MVSIGLCTYNGAVYIRKQLQSIQRQTVQPDELVVCDDGSSDPTREIVADFSQSVGFKVRLVCNHTRLGVVRNFEQALRLCRGEHIALADQDDIWEAHRLEISLRAMRRIERQKGGCEPVLVHNDMSIINIRDEVIDQSYFRRRGFRHGHPLPLKELVLQNYVTGCSVLVNRPLLQLALPFPEGISIHDWWLALIAASAGTLITLRDPTVRYRSHDQNVLGVKRIEWRPYTCQQKALRLFQRAINESRALEKRLNEAGLGLPTVQFLAKYHAYLQRGGFIAAFWLLFEGVRLQNLFPTVMFLAYVALGSFRRLKFFGPA
jgi:glycosyltransferase involved in cell wall biosynthesis